MVNVSGGFAYIDMSVYGKLIPNGDAKEITLVGDDYKKLLQYDKPLIICNLSYEEVSTTYTLAPFIGVREGGIEEGEFVCNITFNKTYSNEVLTLQFCVNSEGTATVELLLWN